MAFKPEPYQATAIKLLLEKPHSGLLLPPGAGKTACVLAARKILKKQKLGRRALVLSTLRSTEMAWARELVKWKDDFGLTGVVAYGPKRLELMREDVDVVITNHDALPWLTKAFTPAQLSGMFDHLIIDESTKFKHTRSRRSKLLKSILGAFERRTILTGTIVPNGLLDLFGQMLVVDRGHRLGQYITRYRLEYFMPTGFGGFTWLPKKDGLKRVRAKTQDVLLWVDDKELHLAKRRDHTLSVKLPREAASLYERFKSECLLELQSGNVKAVNAGVLTHKLRQIANGGLYVGDGKAREVQHVHDAKTEAVVDLVDELNGDPLIIAYEFDHDLQRLLKAFPKAPVVRGGTTLAESTRVLGEFSKGEHPVLLGQMTAVAHGIDSLQEYCANLCWYSMTYDLEIYIQLNRRIHRKGQKRAVGIYHVIAEKTVDEYILSILKRKNKVQNQFQQGLKAHLEMSDNHRLAHTALLDAMKIYRS